PFSDDRAQRNKPGGDVRRLDLTAVDDVVEALESRARVLRRRYRGRVDGARRKRQKSFRRAAGLNQVGILERIEALLAHRQLGEIVRVAADATDADALASQILGTPDVALAHDAVSKNVLHRTDENEIGIAAQERADRSFAADDRHTAVAAAHRGSDDA